MTLQPSIAFDTIEIVGREKEKQIIRDTLLAPNGSQAVFLRGGGGIGKTRLLRWAVDEARKQGVLTSGIVDLYHPTTHSNSGIECAILLGSSHPDCTPIQSQDGQGTPTDNGIDGMKRSFQSYWKQRKEFEKRRQQGSESATLEDLREKIAQTFVEEYNALANTQRILLAFDTAELIQFESDIIQQISQPAEEAIDVKAWMAQVLPRLKNTVILLAGRGPREGRENDPRIQLWSDLERTLAGMDLHIPDLSVFTPEETDQYFEAVAQTAKAQAEQLDEQDEEKTSLKVAVAQIEGVPEDARRRIHQVTGGFPVRLGLAIDLLLRGGDEFKEELEENDTELEWPNLLAYVIARFESIGTSKVSSILVRILACARLGMTAELLQHVLSTATSKPSLAECRQQLDAIARLSFVKKHEAEVFLHDEVYETYEQHLMPETGGEFEEYYRRIAEFYAAGRDPLELSGNAQVAYLHYRLRYHPGDGYQTYVKLDERAIKGHDTGLDLRLRDVILRYLDDSEHAKLAAKYDWPRSKIDQDCAVRWVKRHVARHDHQRAVAVAETVLALGPEPYRSWTANAGRLRSAIPADIKSRAERERIFQTEDPFFWGHLLTYYGEALLYLGKSEELIASALNKVIDLLEPGEEEVEKGFQGWLRARILGRTYNNRGYLHWVHGRFGQALAEFERALTFFDPAKINIPDERADTLTNLAFLLGLLGRTETALTHIERAIKLRTDIGQPYPLALSQNTRGYIHTWNDHPMWGQQMCQMALDKCVELGERRGKGLAYIGLGFALRKRGDQWKIDVYPYNEAQRFFRKAEKQLKSAQAVFRLQNVSSQHGDGENSRVFTETGGAGDISPPIDEPIRLWDATNELGSLYCDWAFLARRMGDAARAKRLYKKSEQYQRGALEIARMHGLAYQEADSRDDLAQVLADQRRFEEAEQELTYIEDLLVPDVFKLKDSIGFVGDLEEGETALLSMGKICLQRGIWAFRSIEYDQLTSEERELKLRQGVREFALSTAYLSRYWAASDSVRKTLHSFSRRLAEAQVPADLAREVVQEVQDKYRLDLRTLQQVIDDTLGI